MERKPSTLDKLDWQKASDAMSAADQESASRPYRDDLKKVQRELAHQRRFVRGEVVGAEVGDASVRFALLLDPDEVALNSRDADHAINLERLAINDIPIEAAKIRLGTSTAAPGDLRLALVVTGAVDPKMAPALRVASVLSVRGALDDFRRLDAYGSR